MKRIFSVLKYPKLLLIKLDSIGIIRLKDKFYVSILFEKFFNKKINWDNPITFNEKLQWLKIYDRKNIYTTMVDKYEAKKYVANIIGEEYIIPTLGVYNKFDDIDFDKLPNQFVIKCTHDSGGIVIVEDKSKFDIRSARKKINKSLKNNFYYMGREWPYKNVKPRIIIEQYMSDSITKDLKDYKFFIFNGSVKCFKIDFNRFSNHKANYFDKNGNLLRFGEIYCPPDFNKELEIPCNLKKMVNLAEKLANNIPFVRIDFYNIDNCIYFGEITFYPMSGFGKFIPEEWDRKLGDFLKIKNR